MATNRDCSGGKTAARVFPMIVRRAIAIFHCQPIQFDGRSERSVWRDVLAFLHRSSRRETASGSSGAEREILQRLLAFVERTFRNWTLSTRLTLRRNLTRGSNASAGIQPQRILETDATTLPGIHTA